METVANGLFFLGLLFEVAIEAGLAVIRIDVTATPDLTAFCAADQQRTALFAWVFNLTLTTCMPFRVDHDIAIIVFEQPGDIDATAAQISVRSTR